MKSYKTGLLVAVFILGSVGASSYAQTSKGILAGTVRDKTGAAIAHASVTVKSQDTGEIRTVTTTAQGAYRADAINPGRYSIHVTMNGFNTTDVKDVAVAPSVVTTYDPQLTVGNVSTDVSVEAISNTINTENGQLSGTIDATELAKTPIFSLNPYELVATLPGVQLINPSLNLNLTGSGGNYQSLSVNGARPRSNNYMLDSQDINDVGIGGQSFNPQVPDMYQSVTALTNSTSAEYGRSGGAVINLTTKSGTNQFHASLFELYSGSGLDALDGVTRQGKETAPFTPGYQPPQKARYDQHQFGFTAGGPIWKNKLFAFGGTQFTRFYGTSASGLVVLPDAAGYAELTAIGKSATTSTAAAQIALLQGLLNNGSYLNTYTNITVTNPSSTRTPSIIANGADCPGGTGTCAVTTANFQRPPVAQQEPDTQWLYRIDFIPHAADTFTVRYLHDRFNFTPDLSLNASGLPGFDGQVGGPVELGEGTWTHVFSANLLNELRVSEVRLSDLFAPTPQTSANPLAALANIALAGSSLPTLGVSQNIPQGRKQELYQLQDAVSWVKGRQSLRLGFDIGRDMETDLVAQNALGQYTFASTDANNSQLDNLLKNQLGKGGSVTRSFGPTRLDPHLWKIAGFAQDDIKLTPELTINLGVRYDYDTNPENVLPYPAVDVTKPFQSITAVVRVQADLNNIAPRFGFAYNPHAGFFADGKTVFHGGFGIFYDVDFTNIVINSVSGANAPTGLVTGSAANNNGANATALFGTITPVLTAQSTVLSVANNMVNPLTYQYNFGIEREVPGQVKVAVNYVGSLGRKLFASEQINPYSNGVRLNTTRGAITVRDNGADSNYNSAQVEVSRAFRNGLLFRASYAYSKLLDDSSEIFALFSNPNTAYGANLQNLHQDYSNSSFDRRHIASFEYVYAPAGFHSSNLVANGLLEAFTRHFIVSGTTQFSSGPYSSFQITGFDTNGDLNAFNDRPLVGNPGLPITAVGEDGYFLPDILDKNGRTIAPANQGTLYDLATYNTVVAKNPNDPSALKAVTAGQERFVIQLGNQATTSQEVGRNSFQNPGQSFWNVALEKDIPAGFKHFEHGQFVLRAEGQNVGNHNNVSVLDTNLLDLGKGSYLNKAIKRENTNQHYRLWAKYTF